MRISKPAVILATAAFVVSLAVMAGAAGSALGFLLREQGIPPERFDIDAPDFVTAARGFGCEAAVAHDSRDLERLLADSGLWEDGPMELRQARWNR
jgi:hypothetical protein